MNFIYRDRENALFFPGTQSKFPQRLLNSQHYISLFQRQKFPLSKFSSQFQDFLATRFPGQVPYVFLTFSQTLHTMFWLNEKPACPVVKNATFPGNMVQVSLQYEKLSHHFFVYFFILLATNFPPVAKFPGNEITRFHTFFQACLHLDEISEK